MDFVVIFGFVAMILAFILLAGKLNRDMRKRLQNPRTQEREARLLDLYEHLEDLMELFEEYFGDVRREIEEKREEVSELATQMHILSQRITEAQRYAATPQFPPNGGFVAPPPVYTEPDIQPMTPAPEALATARATVPRPVNERVTPKSAPSQAESLRAKVPVRSSRRSGKPVGSLSAVAAGVPTQAAVTAQPVVPALEPVEPATLFAPRPPAYTAPMPPAPLPAEMANTNGGRNKPLSALLSQRDRDALDRFPTKAQKVRFLMSRGLPLEDIARELGIGKGEVRLITDLEI